METVLSKKAVVNDYTLTGRKNKEFFYFFVELYKFNGNTTATGSPYSSGLNTPPEKEGEARKLLPAAIVFLPYLPFSNVFLQAFSEFRRIRHKSAGIAAKNILEICGKYDIL